MVFLPGCMQDEDNIEFLICNVKYSKGGNEEE